MAGTGRFGMPAPGTDQGSDPFVALAALLDAAHAAAPVEFPAAVRNAAARMGATDVEVLLIDWQQEQLMPLRLDEPDQGGEPVRTEGTAAGRAFARGAPVVTASAGGGVLISTPLLDGIERLGVLQLSLSEGGDTAQAHCRRFADLVTQFIATKGRCTDEYHLARQRQPMSLAAQMQWQLLPPMTAHAPSATIAGQLEPAYEVGGDAFDYAVNRDRLHIGIFDAMGHGVPAGVITTLSIAAYRNSRRRGRSLVQVVDDIDAELAAQFRDERYVTAMLGELDLATGSIALVSAGHPQPLLLRGRHIVALPRIEPTLPLGLGLPDRSPARVTEARLQVGDRLLLVTDGILDARDITGTPFGTRRLTALVERAALDQTPMVELVRSISHGVIAYQNGNLRDDASLLMVEYFGSDGQRPPAGQAPGQ